MKTLRHTFYLTASALLAGCQLAPDYHQPAPALPSELTPAGELSEPASALSAEQLGQWWTLFRDPELDSLVERALGQNFDVRAAMERVLAARANLGYAQANRWPNITAGGSVSRQDYPDYLYNSSTATGGTQDAFQLLGMLDYEVDLWGKLANASKSSREQLLATAYAYQGVRTALVAEVASTYFNLIATRRQIAITYDTIHARQSAYELQTVRWENGFITELEKQQAASELAAARAALPDLRERASLLETSLAVLVGASPQELWREIDVSGETRHMAPPPEIPLTEVPVALLSRRPDILAADAQARGLTYEIGVVKAERWPTITLGTLGGLVADPMGKVFSSDNLTWSITGTITGTLYDFGRNASRVEAAEATQREALLRYEQVVQQAFRELRDAVSKLKYSDERVVARSEQLAANDRTVELAQSRYDEGYSDYLNLLSAQSVQFNVQLSLVEARLSRYLAVIELCKSLGGGWNVPADRDATLLVFEPAPPTATEENAGAEAL